ncbi:Uu.00g017590.m01.CDS01 [Anthostomella pinea]|uniref:Uu.00g017590.m01.CDS01 n=1 Tax=Anthostomella pinea TaxID=933095 RepID=A0AAI8YQM0_9PEZI|nr:Uu.00g017590.m01.CDS01 [Anthostomella pinea]
MGKTRAWQARALGKAVQEKVAQRKTEQPPNKKYTNKGMQESTHPGLSWEKYATKTYAPTKRTLGFGDLASSNGNQHFAERVGEVMDSDQDIAMTEWEKQQIEVKGEQQQTEIKEEEKQTDIDILAHAPKEPRYASQMEVEEEQQQIKVEEEKQKDIDILARTPKGPRFAFRQPGPDGYGGYSKTRHRIDLPDRVVRKSLEELLLENPDKQLKGIDQSTLDLAANTILQIANEATQRWLRRWCPRMPWKEVFDAIRAEGTEEHDNTNIYLVPKESLDLEGQSSVILAQVFRQCHGVRKKGSPTQPSDVIQILVKCALLCGMLKDEKHKVLLQKAKEQLQWLPVDLEAQERYAYVQALVDLKQLDKKLEDLRKMPYAMRWTDEQRESLLKAEELTILNRAFFDFELERVAFRLELLKTIQVLHQSTSTSAD